MAIAKDAISGKRLLEGDKEFYAIIILDVKNAFSSADWNATLITLDAKDVPNYLVELIKANFKDRVLLYDTDDDRKSYAVSASRPGLGMHRMP